MHVRGRLRDSLFFAYTLVFRRMRLGNRYERPKAVTKEGSGETSLQTIALLEERRLACRDAWVSTENDYDSYIKATKNMSKAKTLDRATQNGDGMWKVREDLLVDRRKGVPVNKENQVRLM